MFTFVILFVQSFAQPVLWTVLAGMIDQPLSGSKALSVEKIIYHANFRQEGLSYDIALMKLKLPLSFNGKNLLCKIDIQMGLIA